MRTAVPASLVAQPGYRALPQHVRFPLAPVTHVLIPRASIETAGSVTGILSGRALRLTLESAPSCPY
jgi:hypothetical protein